MSKRILLAANASIVVLLGLTACQSTGAAIARPENMMTAACLMGDEVASRGVGGQFGAIGAGLMNTVSDQLGEQSPLCAMRDNPAGLLLLTVNYVDKAALHAADGVTTMQEALGLDATLTQERLQLERALNGDSPDEMLNDDMVAITRSIGDAAALVEAELARREGEFHGDPQLEAMVLSAMMDLENSAYYQVQSGLGATAVVRKFGAMSGEQTANLFMTNSEAGEGGALAERAVSSLGTMVQNIGSALSLNDDVQRAISQEALETARAELEQNRETTEADAREASQRIAAQTEAGPFSDAAEASAIRLAAAEY